MAKQIGTNSESYALLLGWQEDDSLSGWKNCQHQRGTVYPSHQTGVWGDEEVLCK